MRLRETEGVTKGKEGGVFESSGNRSVAEGE